MFTKVLSSELQRNVETFLDLGGGAREHVGVRVGAAAVHVPWWVEGGVGGY